MNEKLELMIQEAVAHFAAATDSAGLANAKARFLGKDGLLTQHMKGLGQLKGDERAQAGKALNETKQAIEQALSSRQHALEQAALQERLAAEAIDVTLPGRGMGQGGLHPVTLTIERIERIFRSIGFDVAEIREKSSLNSHPRSNITR